MRGGKEQKTKQTRIFVSVLRFLRSRRFLMVGAMPPTVFGGGTTVCGGRDA